MPQVKLYTVGFVFDPSFSKVLLVHKNRPDWQKGKLNGIGGKIEPGEESRDCMVREFFEETSIRIEPEAWTHVGELGADGWRMDVWTHRYDGDPAHAKTVTDEKIEWFDAHRLPENALGNLQWLVPLAIDKLQRDEFHVCSVKYHR